MLYDNALLCELYLKSYLTYHDTQHLSIAKEIADFWIEKMSEDLLFYSASDADTKGEEGEYFVYSYDELTEAFKVAGIRDIENSLLSIGVTPQGNFEGKNIVNFIEGEKPENFEQLKEILQSIRQKRIYPFIDKKIQVSWSSMMIKALFSLGYMDSKYKDIAKESLQALLSTMYIDGTLYHTTLIEKTPKVEAFLEDYAFLGSALIEAFHATQDESYLIQAQTIGNKALELFYNQGSWNFSVGEFETKAEITDSTYIGSVNMILDLLQSLSILLSDAKYKHFVFKTLEYNSYELGRKPVYYPYMLQQMLRYLKGDRLIKAKDKILLSNIKSLKAIQYPFIQVKLENIDEVMICGDVSCFANTKDISQVEELVNNSL
jgi:hypothetical protein